MSQLKKKKQSRLQKLAHVVTSYEVQYFLCSGICISCKYLKDIDIKPEAEIEDTRPEYENQSTGYLKIRHLNQGLIIRRQEGDDIGIEKLVKLFIGVFNNNVIDALPIFTTVSKSRF